MRILVAEIWHDLILVSDQLLTLLLLRTCIWRTFITTFLLSLQIRHRFCDERPILLIWSYFHFSHHKFLIPLRVRILKLTAFAATLRHTIKVTLKVGNP